jgi:hypothetical protein
VGGIAVFAGNTPPSAARGKAVAWSGTHVGGGAALQVGGDGQAGGVRSEQGVRPRRAGRHGEAGRRRVGAHRARAGGPRRVGPPPVVARAAADGAVVVGARPGRAAGAPSRVLHVRVLRVPCGPVHTPQHREPVAELAFELLLQHQIFTETRTLHLENI